MKKILVTGGTGFVGRGIVDELLRYDRQVVVTLHEKPLHLTHRHLKTVQCNIEDYESCRIACSGITEVIHAAGSVGAAGVSPLDSMRYINKNLVLTLNVLQAAWESGVEKVLIFGSSTGYPVSDSPQREEDMWNGEPHPAYLGYGWMRRYLEKLGEFVQSKSGIRVVVVRPSAVYGPGDNFSPSGGHVIPSLVRRAVKRENPFVVWGSGDEERDFLHIRDFSRGTVLAFDRMPEGSAVNIGYGGAVTIKEVVREVVDATGHEDAEIVFDNTKPTTIPVRRVDISLAKKLIGFTPEISLHDGIVDTVRWYIDSYGGRL